MDEKLLHQILLTVNEVKTVSELANLLYLSQPYVSQIITKAEGHYHVRLVNRNRVPISLTPAGAELARGLEKIIGDRIQLEHELEHYSPNQKPLIKVALAPLLSLI
ncbi:LysR family transcriptional regulator, partial [Lactobacillus sp. XV13L]|nr:LysR family transcriptional regulator [Lactobacillus sp. XV13L]